MTALHTNSDILAAWDPPRTGTGGSGIGGTNAAALASDDGITSYITANVNGGNGSNPTKFGLDGTITPGATYIVTIKIAALLNDNVDVTNNGTYFACSLIDSAGHEWISTTDGGGPNHGNAALAANEISATHAVFTTFTRTIVCSGTPLSSGNTGNALWIACNLSLAAGTSVYVAITYADVAPAAHTITATMSDAHVTSDHTGANTVNDGATLRITLTVANGYSLDNILLDGVTIGNSAVTTARTNGYYDIVSNADHTVAFSTVAAGNGASAVTVTAPPTGQATTGTISGIPTTVHTGDVLTITARPTPGNRVTHVAINGVDQSATYARTTNDTPVDIPYTVPSTGVDVVVTFTNMASVRTTYNKQAVYWRKDS